MFIDIFFSAKKVNFCLSIKPQRILAVTIVYNKSFADAKYFFNAYPQPCKYLKHSVLQSFAEGQKFVWRDRLGTAFQQRN